MPGEESTEVPLDFTGKDITPFSGIRVGSFSIILSPSGDIVLLDGRVKGTLSFICDRCGKIVDEDFHLPFMETLKRGHPRGGDEGNQGSFELVQAYFDGEGVFVEELVLEHISLNFPQRKLCREECKGLCQYCGRDLNEGTCGCEPRSIDPRMEILRKLLDNKEK